MAAFSDGTVVPANCDITPLERRARIEEIYEPYHRMIAETLAARKQAARPTIVIALHSFTPSMAGVARPWDIGVLYADGNISFAQAVLAMLRDNPDICTGDNEPYRMDDTDNSVPRHAFASGLPYVEVEVNQRRLADDAGRRGNSRYAGNGPGHGMGPRMTARQELSGAGAATGDRADLDRLAIHRHAVDP